MIRFIPIAAIALLFATPLFAQTPNGLFADGFESPDSCPAGRQTSATVCYRYGPTDCTGTDVTQFANVLGRSTSHDAPTPFPGKQGFAIVKDMHRTTYLALGFTAPAAPLNSWGLIWKLVTSGGPNTDASITRYCGDFTPPDYRCATSNVLTGGTMAAWRMPEFTGTAQCPLTPGEHYYLNVRITDPLTTHFDCSRPDHTGPTCGIGIQNNHNP